MIDLIGKSCLIVDGYYSFQKDIHTITRVHPMHDTMVYLDNNFDSMYHCVRALHISDDIEKLQDILKLQEDYTKSKESLQYQLECLESEYMKSLKECCK